MKRALALMLVVAAVAATAIAVGAATAAPAKKQDTNPQRGGQLVRLPARLEVDPRTRIRVRLQRLVLADRLGWRHRRRSRPGRSTSARPTRRCSNDQAAACKGCVQIPWALSATSIMYNLPGLNCTLRVTGPILAKIYLGEITTWNDAAITKINPKCTLPSTKITPVYRSDNSGTSYNFTDYLSAVSPAWKSKLGVGVNAAVAGRRRARAAAPASPA